jgi:hypothetical protein
LTTVVAVLLLPIAGFGQSESTGGLIIESSPSGAEIVLKGDALVTGITPTTFHYPLVGDYRLTIKKHGFEDYKTRMVLDPSRQMHLNVELARKTGIKAAVRSVFIPGWGQRYADKRTKSFLFGALFAGAAVAYFVADHNFDIKEERYCRRLADFDDAMRSGSNQAELERRLDALTEAQRDAYDAEDIRRVTIGATVGIWGLSILDALFFTPGNQATFSVKGVSLKPSADLRGVQFSLSSGF